MKYLRFIHVADLHLDTALAGSFLTSSNEHDEVAKRVQDAPFKALENLLKLCEEKKPHFVLFAGDMYNSEEASLKARFALGYFFERLNALAIPVFYAHGNHDPLTAKVKKDLFPHDSHVSVWPKNVHVFTEMWAYIPYAEDVHIYGISHTKKQETQNLTEFFGDCGYTVNNKIINIGVLHTSLLGEGQASTLPNFSERRQFDKTHPMRGMPSNITTNIMTNITTDMATSKTLTYAPCSLADLEKLGMDYWALGHTHSAQILMENPCIAYAGSMQGLHIKETGAHGCLYVEIDKFSEKRYSAPKTTFISLAPVEWHVLSIDLQGDIALEVLHKRALHSQDLQAHDLQARDLRTGALQRGFGQTHAFESVLDKDFQEYSYENILELQDLIIQSIRSYLEKTLLGTQCETLFFRVELYGRSNLATLLQEKDIQLELCRALEKNIHQHSASFRIMRESQNSPPHTHEAFASTSNTLAPHLDIQTDDVLNQANSVPMIYFKDIKSYVRPLFDFESALSRDDILGEVFRVSHDLKKDKKALRALEKQASETLRSKIIKYTANLPENAQIEQRNVSDFIDKAEEICIEVFEPQEK